MSLLAKLGLVEDEQKETNIVSKVEEETIIEEAAITIERNSEFEPATVEEIYGLFKEKLMPQERSIYKVKEFGAAFPDSLPKETKKAALIGVLQTAGFKVEELLEDAETRKTFLQTANTTVSEENNTKIETLALEIGELSKKIESLKEQVVNYGKLSEEQAELVKTEIKKIEEIENLIK